MSKKQFVNVTINHEALAKANGKKVGDTIRVDTCRNGVPLSQYWRNRFKDVEKEKGSEKSISIAKPSSAKPKASKED